VENNCYCYLSLKRLISLLLKSKVTGSCRVIMGGATQERPQHQQQKQISSKRITSLSHSPSLPLSVYLSIYLSTSTHSLYLCMYLSFFLSIYLSIPVFFSFLSLPSLKTAPCSCYLYSSCYLLADLSLSLSLSLSLYI